MRGCPPSEAREIVVEHLVEQGAEGFLLETNGVQMDVFETICRERGLTFEEAHADMYRHYLEKGDSAQERDEADWWKA